MFTDGWFMFGWGRLEGTLFVPALHHGYRGSLPLMTQLQWPTAETLQLTRRQESVHDQPRRVGQTGQTRHAENKTMLPHNDKTVREIVSIAGMTVS